MRTTRGVTAVADENEGSSTTPPWGDDFQPEKAWNTIQEQRAAEKSLREQLREAQSNVMTDEQRQNLEQYQSLVEASQTDDERRQQQIDSLTAAANKVPTLEAQNLRLQVALDKGLPATLASRLQGNTREEVEADADALAGLMPQSAPKVMKPNPAQGTSGGGAPSLEQRIAEADKSGDRRQVLRLKALQLQQTQN